MFCSLVILVIEARDYTIDVEVENINGLTSHLVSQRDRWEDIYREASIVAENLGIENHHRILGIRRGMVKITPDTYRINVFYKAIDSVLADMATRYQAISVDVSRNINRKLGG